MFLLQMLAPFNKAIMATAVTAGVAYASKYGINVPAETQNWLVDLGQIALSGVVGGGLTWLVPNINSVPKTKRQRK